MTWAEGLVGIVGHPDSWGYLGGASPCCWGYLTRFPTAATTTESQGRPEGGKDLSSLHDGRPVLGAWLRESRVQGSEDSLAPKAHRRGLADTGKAHSSHTQRQECGGWPEAKGSHTLSSEVRDLALGPLLTVPAHGSKSAFSPP